eukprot:gene15526-20958_t
MSELMKSASAPYGLKAIRQMRETKPSQYRVKKINDTYNYFLEKVDPIIGACITTLLCEQPDDVLSRMFEFIQSYDINKTNNPPNNHNNDHYHTGRVKKELKIYLATTIGPIVAKLVNRVAILKPENVQSFLCEELSVMIADNPYVPTNDTKTEIISRISEPLGTVLTPHPILQPTGPVMKNIQIAVIGMDKAGKTSIMNILQGIYDPKPKVTVGFKPVTMKLGDELQIKFYDLGGGKKIRDIWDQYYHDVHAVIYVIDSASNQIEIEDNLKLFNKAMSDQYLQNKPVLVLANKQDLNEAKDTNELSELLQLQSLFDSFIIGCSSFVPETIGEDINNNNNYQPDIRIETGIERLLTKITSRYDELNERVNNDTKNKTKEDNKKRIARERNVLKNKIAMAFADQVDKTKYSDEIDVDHESLFTEEEGIKYLAGEIGDDPVTMNFVAKNVAALVGYQRLSLSIVGALKEPISKKKVPMQWNEIYDMVVEIRGELGLV